MALFSKSTESAQNAVAAAESVVQKWEKKAADARAEAARLDAESGAAILEDESAAERITLNVQTWERKARAFDQAAGEARQKLQAARKDALEAEAREEDKLAAAARRAAEAHASKVAALLAELKLVDACDYVPGRATTGWAAERGLNQVPASVGKLRTVREHETRAAIIRYFLKAGAVPKDYDELNDVLGTDFDTMCSFNEVTLPESVYVARNAGLTFVGA
jgi:hypothetical protein